MTSRGDDCSKKGCNPRHACKLAVGSISLSVQLEYLSNDPIGKFYVENLLPLWFYLWKSLAARAISTIIVWGTTLHFHDQRW